jgi:hypothetical protein
MSPPRGHLHAWIIIKRLDTLDAFEKSLTHPVEKKQKK